MYRADKPFNLDLADYESMYRGLLPNGIAVSINTLTNESVTYADVETLRMRIADVYYPLLRESRGDPLGVRKLSPCPIIDMMYCVHPHVLTPDVEANLTPEQKAWMVNGWYHQIGFYVDLNKTNESDEQVVHEGTGIAMIFLDWWHCVSKSFDPSLHLPQTFDRVLADHHNSLVGDLYQTGTAIWHERLVQLRNELLIVIHAADTGQNVFQALGEFRSSGRQSFLW